MENCTTCGSKIPKRKTKNYKENLNNLMTIFAYIKILKANLIQTKYKNFKLRKHIRNLVKIGSDQEKENIDIKLKFQEVIKKMNLVRFNYFNREKRLRYRVMNSNGKWVRISFAFKFDLWLIKDEMEKLLKFLKDFVENDCFLRINLLERSKTYQVAYNGVDFAI